VSIKNERSLFFIDFTASGRYEPNSEVQRFRGSEVQRFRVQGSAQPPAKKTASLIEKET